MTYDARHDNGRRTPSPAVYAKAIVAGCTALTGALVTAASDGTVTVLEGIIVAATVLGAAAATYAVPNRDDGDHGDQSVQDEADMLLDPGQAERLD